MRRDLCASLLIVFFVLFGTHPAQAGAPCEAPPSEHIPPRPQYAPTGQTFARQIAAMDDDAREAAIYQQLITGNIPSFLRQRHPVRVTAEAEDGSTREAIICAAPDYLAVGTDDDYLFVPMRLGTAIAVAARYGDTLPTRRLVDAIYDQSRVHLSPQPLPASDAMRSTAYYWNHNRQVQQQRSSFSEPLGTLTAGDKKDLVLTTRLWSLPERVAIYGWHEPDGRPIQPLSTVHGSRYADYSHGVRLVSAIAYVGGVAQPLLELLSDPSSAPLFSDEGAIPNLPDLLKLLSVQRGALHKVSIRSAH